MSDQPLSIENQKEFLGHPVGLYVCFTTELWERFSFYGMKFLLLLYITKYHLFSDDAGLDVLGAYAGLVYAMPVIGGLIADRYLGTKKAVIFGGILLAIGHLLMAVEGEQAINYAAGTVLSDNLTLKDGTVILAGTTLTEAITQRDTFAINVFYLALAFIVTGVGYLKPNISVIVGDLYKPNDPRRDSAFTIFYMGINIGSVVAITLCGLLGETYGWKYGFGLAGIGMVIGLITFILGQKHLHGLADAPNPERLKEKKFLNLSLEYLIYLATLPSIAFVWWLVQSEPVVHLTQYIFLVLSIIGLIAYSMLEPKNFAGKNTVLVFTAITMVLGILTALSQNHVLNLPESTSELLLYTFIAAIIAFVLFGIKKQYSDEFSRTVVLMILICSTIVFWSLFEQAAASMTLFADRSVDRTIAGITYNASQFGALNPAFIMIFAIPFAFLWPWLSKRNMNPNTPIKFGLGLIQAGLGFGALVLGAQFPDEAGKVAVGWLALAYLLHSTGELCLSPIGLSAVTKLSIGKVVSVSMGTWFLATALAETLATRISKLASIDTSAGDADPLHILETYTNLFEFLMWFGIGFGIFMIVISPLLKKGMKGVQ